MREMGAGPAQVTRGPRAFISARERDSWATSALMVAAGDNVFRVAAYSELSLRHLQQTMDALTCGNW
jgi:hypothetical protein